MHSNRRWMMLSSTIRYTFAALLFVSLTELPLSTQRQAHGLTTTSGVGRRVKADSTLCSKFTGVYDPVYYCWLADPCVDGLPEAPRFLYSETCSGSTECEPLPSGYADCKDWTISDGMQSCTGYGPFPTCCERRTCSPGQVCFDLVPGAAFCRTQTTIVEQPSLSPSPIAPSPLTITPSPPASSPLSPFSSMQPLFPPSIVPDDPPSSSTSFASQGSASTSPQSIDESPSEWTEPETSGSTSWNPASSEPLFDSPSMLPLLSPDAEPTAEPMVEASSAVLEEIDSPLDPSSEVISSSEPERSVTLVPSSTTIETPSTTSSSPVESSPFLLPLLSPPEGTPSSAVTIVPEEPGPDQQDLPILLPVLSASIEPSPQTVSTRPVLSASIEPSSQTVSTPPPQPQIPPSFSLSPQIFPPTSSFIPVNDSPVLSPIQSASPTIEELRDTEQPEEEQLPMLSPSPQPIIQSSDQQNRAVQRTKPKSQPSWTTAFIILVVASAITLAAVMIEKRKREDSWNSHGSEDELAIDESFWKSLAAKKQFTDSFSIP